jgi:hypothetical protein
MTTSCEGGIRNGVLEGDGSYSFANGAAFKGNFQNGKPNGFGFLSYANGCKYEGQFKDGKRHGTLVHLPSLTQ